MISAAFGAFTFFRIQLFRVRTVLILREKPDYHFEKTKSSCNKAILSLSSPIQVIT